MRCNPKTARSGGRTAHVRVRWRRRISLASGVARLHPAVPGQHLPRARGRNPGRRRLRDRPTQPPRQGDASATDGDGTDAIDKHLDGEYDTEVRLEA